MRQMISEESGNLLDATGGPSFTAWCAVSVFGTDRDVKPVNSFLSWFVGEGLGAPLSTLPMSIASFLAVGLEGRLGW